MGSCSYVGQLGVRTHGKFGMSRICLVVGVGDSKVVWTVGGT